jgi:hypothetical protein
MATLVTSLDWCRVNTTSLRLPVESLDVPAGHVEQAEEPEAMTFITASLSLIYKSPLPAHQPYLHTAQNACTRVHADTKIRILSLITSHHDGIRALSSEHTSRAAVGASHAKCANGSACIAMDQYH